MKKLFLILITIGLLGSFAYSQNDLGKSDDMDRISIAPMISDLSGDIPASAQKILISKMKQIATKNGMAALPSNPMFIMYPTVSVLSKETTPTAPPMQAINIEVSFFIADLATGNVYSETSLELKGVGKTEDRAYMQALKNINYKKGQFKAFVETGKEKIVEYFNSNCDVVLSTAKTLISQNKKDLALVYLLSVPPVSKECYDNAMKLAQTIQPDADTLTKEEKQAWNKSIGNAVNISNDSDKEKNNKQETDAVEEDEEDVEDSADTEYKVYLNTNETVYFRYISTKNTANNHFIVKAQFVNKGTNDFGINYWIRDIRVVDGNGNVFDCRVLKSGTRETNTYHKGTIMPEAPMNVELVFAGQVKKIAVIQLVGNYKIRNIPTSTIK